MTRETDFPLLRAIASPLDLRRLPTARLAEVADELRRFLVDSVSRSGGHFAAGLGAVELTVALHYVFNTPEDRIVWDVGHQSYPHKILTGRRERLATVRTGGGLAPFPRRAESEYDTFGVGHAGTSIGAALGMAIAASRNGEDRRSIAVIGDGGLTCGMAFEALNHAGGLGSDLIVVLNDNEMSISPNVGALTRRFAEVLSGRLYTTVREGSKKVLSHMPPVWELARRAEEHVKGLIIPGTLFEEFGFNYIGPIDGHDINALVTTMGNLRRLRGPRLLHVITRKGKGYAPAEADPVRYHGISAPFDPAVGIVPGAGAKRPTYAEIFGEWLCDVAERDPQVVGITPAMREGSKMERFAERFPSRYFDVGIAEQHSVTVAAGMACDGLHPVVAIYSTFLQRAYDSLIHDVVLQQLPVLLAIDRAGLVGGDGPTHNGAFDIPFLRCLPGMVVMTPADENECRRMLDTGHQLGCPCAVRYPRGSGPGVAVEREPKPLEVGRAQPRRRGTGDIAMLVFGAPLADALEVAEEIDASVINMRFAKPIDEDAVIAAAREHRLLVTIEEGAVQGGAGSAVNECLAPLGLGARVLNLGIPDRFIDHGSAAEMRAAAGLDQAGIRAAIDRFRADCDDIPRRATGV